ncbi:MULTISPECIES: pantoate--beta-alanine ligase [Gordonia]|uniref:Pantothenate synthetase n=1 Tax=Gordonia polyisoprenivorans TaxID=84595 RepID=A0A846WJL2_9ACTN|nr:MULTISPECIES: pantoate--beta-alanine ligase [Gordonia]MDF3284245.1 pantoate--beta-alanine ligase [Gordonia sp. N1V]NKY01718.1 pantoate--beta-alanine ligase [Gordonia polyisoprenivorans]WCB36786.1 pantoate--beta-alanine ligase [Gordonia polyisoprenivorans]
MSAHVIADEANLFTPGTLTVHRDPAALHRVSAALRSTGRRVALVPTMGALHAGHLELVRAAKERGNTVVIVSIFVNPLQFGAGEDLDAYPRTFDADLELLAPLGVELVFAPTEAAMYPDGRRTMIHPGPAGDILDGASRPGHFAGMLTVVNKLLHIAAPHTAYFGEKDYQQLVLISQMVADLNMDVEIVGVPTVREADGLAMSSRNRYLSAEQRQLATTLSAALTAGSHAAPKGADAILAVAQEVLSSEPEIELDYLALRGRSLEEPPDKGHGRLLVAARLGAARLIDNVGVAIGLSLEEREARSE